MALSNKLVKKFVSEALQEDAVFSDVTTHAFISREIKVKAQIIAKQQGVLCGMDLVREAFKSFDKKLTFIGKKRDGAFLRRGDCVAVITGRACSVLSCERVALNFVSYLSGISTQTYEVVKKVGRSGIKILDTRKTTPLFRTFEKYAVLTGQGKNHRLNLSDQYLVKDNHLFIIRKTKTLDVLLRRDLKIPFEIEVDNFAQLKEAVMYRPTIVMLDNFSPSEIKQAVSWLKRTFPHKNKRPLIELSGGITYENISRFCIRGVDYISLGALTHSSKALDFSLEIADLI
ncbi:MAG: carboxylating nicotinate-nucleotide diphosphorylase [Candidatus Omnitrophota bacterium]